MRSRFAAPLLLLATLAAVPAAAQVAGRYEVVSINGHALPAPSPTDEGVTVIRASFWFEEDGRFNLAMTADAPDGQASQRAGGTYATVRDSLRVTTEPGTDPATAFRWVRQGDTLRLYDEHENVFQLVREATTGEPWRPGSWNAVQINGHELPTVWPRGPELMVTDFRFVFDADGGLNLHLHGTVGGQPGEEDDNARYTVAGDKITVLDDEDGSVQEEFAWTLREDRLRLVDQFGHVYLFVPAAATAP